MFNLKNKDGQKKFKELTSNTDNLSSIVAGEGDINVTTKKFLKKLDTCIYKCFTKIRIVDRPDKELDELFAQRKILRNKTDQASKAKLEKVELDLAEKCAKANYDKIMDEIENIDCEEGGVNSGNLWKLKKKLSPKCRDPPTAMMDGDGNLITSPHLIENLALNTFSKRLQNRPIKQDLIHLKEIKEKLCKMRLKLATKNKTPPWRMEQLDTVLKELKRNKSRDPMGYAHELFHPTVAGNDLKTAILILMNRIKDEQEFPKALEKCNISSIFKNKGSRNHFEYYRGIFRVPILRTILDKLIYNDEYSNIDEHLSDSNVGARKKRNIRDNVFVLNAITNSVVNGQEDAIDVQVFDVEKCFDSLWLQECINDLFENGFQNDKLPLLFKENSNANIAVKSATGMSNRTSIQNVVMQGTVWGSLMCTASVDQLGKLIYKNDKLLYKYKGVVKTPCLGMVDDILSIQKCSDKTIEMNSVINAFIESKKLTLSAKKCGKVHISKKSENNHQCHKLKVHESEMRVSKQEKYLGDIVHSTGKIKQTLENRKLRAIAIVAEIQAILEDIPLGKYRLDIGLKLRQAMLINGVLFNSEVWHGIADNDVKALERIDEHLLRSLVKAHAKTPIEFLYLESGTMPIRFIISSRRLMYLRTILIKEDDELVRRIFKAQLDNPSPGDYVELLKNDFQMIEEQFEEKDILNKSKQAYKKMIKMKIRKAALNYLNDRKDTHTKIKHIKYETLKCQEYLISSMFSNTDINTLFSLRSRMIDCKVNFRNKHQDNNLKC